MNADPALSGTFKFAMNDGDTYVGKRTPNQTPDIQLNGVGIGKPHCVVNYDSNNRTVTLAPNNEDYKRYKVMVNGVLLEEPVRLNHGDRILIGSHFYYLYVDPMVNFEETADYDAALKEANKDSMGAFSDVEYNNKLKEMEDKIRLEN
jgi:pSer/pThr/pTyr-binding forkhead associated (FHA) protein